MHILMFSYDRTLFEGTQTGDTLLRHKCYADYLEMLDIVVPAPAETRQTEIKVNEKLSIFPNHGPRLLAWWRAYLKARQLCKKSRVDIVVTQDPLLGVLGALLKKEFGCKLFLNMFGTELFADQRMVHGIAHRLFEIAIRWALRSADIVRAESDRVKEFIVDTFKIPLERIVLIYLDPSPESMKSLLEADGREVRKELLGSKFNRMVLSVGRLVPEKDLKTLLWAASQVLTEYPKTLFVIIGDGPERGFLEGFSRGLGIANNVRFLGAVPFSHVPPYFAACDVFALSSRSEGFGRVMAEATLTKKPIVATDVGGAREIIVDDETGYIVRVKDSETMAGRIQRLLGNPQRAKTMGRRGYERAVARFAFGENVKKLITTWESMITEVYE